MKKHYQILVGDRSFECEIEARVLYASEINELETVGADVIPDHRPVH